MLSLKAFLPGLAIGILILGYQGFVRPAHAASFSYSEGTDLPALLPATSVFGFDIGTNTVGGSTSFNPDSTGADFDSFAFSIPPGTTLAQVSFAFTIQTSAGVNKAETSFALDNDNAFPSGAIVATSTIDLLGSSPFAFAAGALPLGPGTYGLNQLNVGLVGGSLPRSWIANYTWSLTVVAASAPEPGSLFLLASGLAAMAAWRWRKYPGKKDFSQSPAVIH
jgi:hypothetical protein